MKNAHLADRKRRSAFDALRVSIMSLPADAQAIFNEARDMYEARFERTHGCVASGYCRE